MPRSASSNVCSTPAEPTPSELTKPMMLPAVVPLGYSRTDVRSAAIPVMLKALMACQVSGRTFLAMYFPRAVPTSVAASSAGCTPRSGASTSAAASMPVPTISRSTTCFHVGTRVRSALMWYRSPEVARTLPSASTMSPRPAGMVPLTSRCSRAAAASSGPWMIWIDTSRPVKPTRTARTHAMNQRCRRRGSPTRARGNSGPRGVGGIGRRPAAARCAEGRCPARALVGTRTRAGVPARSCGRRAWGAAERGARAVAPGAR